MKIKNLINKFGIYVILIIIFVFFAICTDSFLSPKNLFNIGRQVSMIGICAVGMTMVLLTGGIDISVGSIIALVGVVCAKLTVEGNIPFYLSAVLAILVGTLCGLIVGFMVMKFDVPPLIATLAMQTIARGLAFILTGGIPVYGLPDSARFVGQGYIAGVPTPLILMVVIFAVGYSHQLLVSLCYPESIPDSRQ